ncbi:MAG TPA: hypothetical protein QGF58_29475 [Myxococcota bacterium]|nr:hypothetical protein [Myxococcota bacterium]
MRVESVGVVLVCPDHGCSSGEDLRVWFRHEAHTYTFDASILRTGVPVPDRSGHGLLLGFIDGFSEEAPTTAGELSLEVLPPQGRGVDLLGGDAHIVEISVDELSFVVDEGVALKFVAGGRVRLRFTGAGEPVMATARVDTLSRGDHHYLYGLSYQEVDSQEEHVRVVDAFRSALQRTAE